MMTMMFSVMYRVTIIKQILNFKGDSGLPDSFMLGDRVSSDPLTIANAFNDYFTDIGPTLANKIPHSSKTMGEFMPHPPSCSFGLLPTSPQEVMEVAALMGKSVSTGAHDINPTIAISTISLIATPLTSIINSSFKHGLVPTDLKIAKITPIFKAGDKNLITNYRPISVLPFFSKIMEKLMANRLTAYLSKYVPISATQYGFQRGLSTYMALMDMQTNISEAMNQNKFSLGVFFDISKAFDTVNHKLLIKKTRILWNKRNC